MNLGDFTIQDALSNRLRLVLLAEFGETADRAEELSGFLKAVRRRPVALLRANLG